MLSSRVLWMNLTGDCRMLRPLHSTQIVLSACQLAGPLAGHSPPVQELKNWPEPQMFWAAAGNASMEMAMARKSVRVMNRIRDTSSREEGWAGRKPLPVPFLRPRRRRAVHVAIVHDQIERLDRRRDGVAAMHGLAFVADDHVLHDFPDDVVEDRDADERGEAPGNECGAAEHEGGAGFAA